MEPRSSFRDEVPPGGTGTVPGPGWTLRSTGALLRHEAPVLLSDGSASLLITTRCEHEDAPSTGHRAPDTEHRTPGTGPPGGEPGQDAVSGGSCRSAGPSPCGPPLPGSTGLSTAPGAGARRPAPGSVSTRQALFITLVSYLFKNEKQQ
ncbi:hypothetical protein EYF80_057803 [Liparis tanakae]|uniref:Uncharacterized protein n=1 Tax=Liparis tanakae TaxID=230148 RepID=A0A4Z2ETY2_9TELE|nr:hypothetical protein EYF80_057803 [Liparis tanakae]